MAVVHLFVRAGTTALVFPPPLSFQTQDTLTGHFIDSVVVKPVLPDPLVPIVQWIFQKPGWVMVSGIVIAAIAGVALLVILWRRHTTVARWSRWSGRCCCCWSAVAWRRTTT